jgi:hypothetical protein
MFLHPRFPRPWRKRTDRAVCLRFNLAKEQRVKDVYAVVTASRRPGEHGSTTLFGDELSVTRAVASAQGSLAVSNPPAQAR